MTGSRRRTFHPGTGPQGRAKLQRMEVRARAENAEPQPGEAASGVLYGVHTVLEGLRQGKVAFEQLVLSRGAKGPNPQPAQSRLGRVYRLAREGGIPVQFAPHATLDRLSGGGAHQGVVGVIAARPYASLEEVLARAVGSRALLVLVDGVQDPRNLGAILRTSAAAGAAGLLIPTHGACGLTPAVAKAAAGALEAMPVAREANLASSIHVLKERGFWVVGLDIRGDTLWTDVDLTAPTALVVGGEQGLRELVRRRCDRLIRLPVEPPIDSLNVSVATGIALYEALRQRRAGGGKVGGEQR